ncbi:hypothetical protein CO731_01669 [Aminobacter sp. MSH1]|uniref:YdaU family protein n=1 Tax=Aminobacter sp. MSH1 TaxID=374606 RepID=UPI000D38B128|nr:DUF1376 domain-containing protein [Aminobacter sp. MSH1]AWC22213.1 hypothetical protein CO731_01669 [Aminobacter sp. MSH1]
MRTNARRSSRLDVVEGLSQNDNPSAGKPPEAKGHSPAPWFRFFASDWLASTRTLKAAEAGILINLIAMLHERGEPVPEDHDRLGRLCGARKDTFTSALKTLLAEGKIVRKNGGLWSPIIQSETEFRREKSQVAAKNVSGRWKKTEQKQTSQNTDEYRVQSQNTEISDGDLPDRHVSTPSRSTLDGEGTRSSASLSCEKYRVNQRVDHEGQGYRVLSIDEDGKRMTARSIDDGSYETFRVLVDGSLGIDDIPF